MKPKPLFALLLLIYVVTILFAILGTEKKVPIENESEAVVQTSVER